MENTITKKFILVLGIVIFCFAMVKSVSAAYNPIYAFSNNPVSFQSNSAADYYGNGGYPYPQNNYQYPQSSQYPVPYYYPQQVATANTTSTTATKPTSQVVNNYYYYQTPSTAKTSTTSTTGTYTYPSSTTSTSNGSTTGGVINGVNTANNLGASAYNPYAQVSGNGIPALTLRGSGGFMPSSIWQWILVVFLILAIIVLARMFVKKPSPADHDAHGAHAH
ncbi:MAG TPA: hypothetical protein VK153_03825 [Candidatus Paceibacterota bacterium]|nr:hypothetical protein [Candidatus Paceibacterota bacterium]